MTAVPAAKVANPVIEYFGDAIPHFLGYFGIAAVMAVAFIALYVLITPHKELTLIKGGNNAAATQLVGSFLGFAIPMGVVISHSVNILDMLLWGVVVLIVQLVTFFILAKLFPEIEKRIEDNCVASGVFVGGVSLGIGILQAACMVP
jgi:putative membrane protein